MIEDATSLELRGLFRRAMTVWQDVATHPEAEDTTRNHAWSKLMSISSSLSDKTRAQEQQTRRLANKQIKVDSDRQQIIDYFNMGLSPAEIKPLTYRSNAFIYNCKKQISNTK